MKIQKSFWEGRFWIQMPHYQVRKKKKKAHTFTTVLLLAQEIMLGVVIIGSLSI